MSHQVLLMIGELLDCLAGFQFQQLSCTVGTPDEDITPIRGEYRSQFRIAGELAQFLACLYVPQPHGAIIAASENVLAIWRKSYGPYSRLVVAEKSLCR